MSNIEEQINELLVQWNPIELGTDEPIYDEYRSYIPRIKAILSDKAQIKSLLKHIVTEEMGLAYDKHNPDHVSEVEELSKKLNKLKDY
jgi:hypothetical protein